MKINHIGRIGINPYSKQIDNLGKAEKVAKKDKIEISSEALELQKGSPIEAQRQERVQELKEKVKSGEYEINPTKVAGKMYSFWNDEF